MSASIVDAGLVGKSLPTQRQNWTSVKRASATPTPWTWTASSRVGVMTTTLVVGLRLSR